ncbi:LuxR C-terminal-related transcriptional regulator [Zunongwangia sp. F260]|uniref:LuxR C-terminal-related transcriptional regulator n=1 Tax=Autumnicola lenta TaxID=3075593 RepID=A0ABU3CN35_9FLAO|nr:LuxR C-terminal-related transcriptional regulator [Zunongwangia sp. F260]MDT0647765.1 LuxR C-terminal-related transcriptional regulator [Zunongwangia sp. F260]
MGRSLENKALQKKIKDFTPYAEMIPEVVVIHQLHPFTPCYMTSNGLEQLGTYLEELKEIGADYHKRFFNNGDMEGFVTKLKKLISSGDEKGTFTFFQQVKLKDRNDWVWHIASARIFLKDKGGNPTHIITVAIPIDQLKHIPNKAQRFLNENDFFQTNNVKFLSLGFRAKEVLRLVALGKSSSEIAEELFISVETVQTHRKLIKQKLSISSSYEFTLYAHAFDLI